MKLAKRVVESLFVRVGSAVTGIALIAGAVASKWPNPWVAIAVTAGGLLVLLAMIAIILDVITRDGRVANPTPALPLTIDLRPFVVFSPQPGGGVKSRLHMEAVNTCERTLSLAQWTVQQTDGPTVAGSPYEGRAAGPELLQPTQLHGWEVPLDTPGAVFRRDRPITVTVRLTTGETFTTGPISLIPPVLKGQR